MRMDWKETQLRFCRQVLRQQQNMEQSLQLKLPDGMPDVDRVICAWGQCMLQGKQWRKDAVVISGGVKVWVLYGAEEALSPCLLEGWIPFQGKWNLPEGTAEGVVQVQLCLRSLEAQLLSARKLGIHAGVGIGVEALEESKERICQPEEMPAGVEALYREIAVELIREAGEKAFTLEEQLPFTGEKPEKLVCCRVDPQIREGEIVGSRAVFRGQCSVELLYLTGDGALRRQHAQVEFAQFAQLEQECSAEAACFVLPQVTAAEAEILDTDWQLKMELVGQYTVREKQTVSICEDAFGTTVEAVPLPAQIRLPHQKPMPRQQLEIMLEPNHMDGEVVDVDCRPELPVQYWEEGAYVCQLGGQLQVVYYDPQGQLQSRLQPWYQQWQLPAEEGDGLQLYLAAMPWGLQEQGSGMVKVDAMLTAEKPTDMIVGLEMGEAKPKDPARPSVILYRAGKQSLWQIAKECGACVEAIRQCNPELEQGMEGNMLLIPVP